MICITLLAESSEPVEDGEIDFGTAVFVTIFFYGTGEETNSAAIGSTTGV